METNGDHFLTLVYTTVDAETLELRYCAAGHPGPILVRAGEQAKVLESTGPPIGIVAFSKYRTIPVQLQPGDRLYLFSDGLEETMNPARELFGRARIETVIGQARELSLDASIDALVDAVMQSTQGWAAALILMAFVLLAMMVYVLGPARNIKLGEYG